MWIRRNQSCGSAAPNWAREPNRLLLGPAGLRRSSGNLASPLFAQGGSSCAAALLSPGPARLRLGRLFRFRRLVGRRVHDGLGELVGVHPAGLLLRLLHAPIVANPPAGGKRKLPERFFKLTHYRIDSQSVDTSEGGERRGRDNAKNVNGRKRHLLVDSMGLLLAVLVTAADVDDAAAAPELFARLEGQPVSRVRRVYADGKYHNYDLYAWVEENAAWDLTVVRRPAGARGWVLLPIRWTVERTFAWLGRCRRLSKDRERSVLSAEAFVKLAMIHLMLNRLHPKEDQPAFQYRNQAA
jgi:transposase